MACFAPAKTPRDIVLKLNTDIVAITRQPEVGERLLKEGADPGGNPPHEFGAYIRSEIAKWSKVVKAARLQSN